MLAATLQTPQQETLRYRADIDGLRAVAVLAVVVYHLMPAVLPGGFVGVDVFFVISGYLISGIVEREIRDGRFRLSRFYQRRARRILPALFVMLAGCAVAAYFWFLPDELRGFAKQLTTTLLSVSNLYFWVISWGYFGSTPDSVPLLHTWSLGVEEQFYVFLPLLLVGLHKWCSRPSRGAVLWGIAVVSLIVSVWTVAVAPSTAFYWLHTRAWELLSGAFVTLGLVPLPRTKAARETCAAAGALLIGIALVALGPRTPFPGLAALLPCVGSALVIMAGQEGTTKVGAALTWRPVVFVGLISYSLYLWHWPVIIFSKASLLVPADVSPAVLGFGLFTLSMILATASWRFVEQPFRHAAQTPWPAAWKMLATTAAVLLAVAGVMFGRLPARFSPDAQRVASYVDYAPTAGQQARTGRCFISTGYEYSDFRHDECLSPATDRPNYLLMGDSHAAALWPGLVAKARSAHLMQATASGCKPLIALTGDTRCTDLNRYIFHTFLQEHRPDLVILSARWFESDLEDLPPTLDWFREKQIKVLLVGPIVEYDQAFARVLTFAIRRNDPSLVAAHHTPEAAVVDAAMERIAAAAGVPYASTYRTLCPAAASCTTLTPDGAPVQWDYGHLTDSGSSLMVQSMISRGMLGAP